MGAQKASILLRVIEEGRVRVRLHEAVNYNLQVWRDVSSGEAVTSVALTLSFSNVMAWPASALLKGPCVP